MPPTYAPSLSATDASEKWEAEVAAPIPRVLARELFRHTLQKPTWVHMLRPLQERLRREGNLPPDEELPEGEPYPVHPLWVQLARSLTFSCRWRKKLKRPKHINTHELDAVLEAEKRISETLPHSRLLLASDSQVALGALLKGRSSSRQLNKQAPRQFVPCCWR